MGTRSNGVPLTGLVGGLVILIGLGVSALAAQAQTPAPSVGLYSQGRLKILTGTVRPEKDGVRVFGLVRRAALWRGGVDGHLDIDLYDLSGRRVEHTSVKWNGRLGSGHAARYEAAFPTLKIDRVARVDVTYSPVADGAQVSEAAR